MADSLKFSKGLQQYLPSTLEDNTFYVTTDTHKIYLQGGVWEDTSSINETIGEIEEVVAESLTDLDARLKVIEDKTSDSETEEEPNVSSSTIKVTYEELKELRNNGELIPSVKYRITDYVTTTAQEYIKSACHPFDIIVEALSEYTLSEDAKAIQNEIDGYFDDCNLNAWEIKYCIDNYSDRFAWVSTIENALNKIEYKYMLFIDDESSQNLFDDYKKMGNDDRFIAYGYENNNEGELCLVIYKTDIENYDNIIDIEDRFFYEGTQQIEGVTYDKWRKIDNNGYTFDSEAQIYVYTELIVENNTIKEEYIAKEGLCKGVIYYMKDEYGNECPYDFKNIKFYNENDENFYYTFSFINENDEIEDLTLRQVLLDDEGFCHGTHHNIIKPNYLIESSNLIQELNKNIFILTNSYQSEYYGCYNNIFNVNCHDNIIYCNGFRNNVFGENCYNNTFDDICCNNKLGNYCYDNTFGYYCINNTLGNECYNNTFGNDCINNTFGNYCRNNTFGNECNYNTLGNECYNNTLGNECHNNTFGTYCINNTFDDRCYNNTFGNDCINNTFGNDCINNTFGNECNYNKLGIECYDNTFGNYCRNNTFGNYCFNITFGNECNYNKLGIECYNNTFSNDCINNTLDNYCYNNTFGNECNGNTFGNECNYNKLGNYCYNNTFGNNCFNISFYDGSSTYFNDELSIYQSDDALLNNVNNNRFGDGCKNLLIHIGTVNTYNEESSVQNLTISQGLSSTKKDDNNNFELELIPINVFNQDYEIKVAKNSKGEIKIYCEADLIA